AVLQELNRAWGGINGSETWSSATDCDNMQAVFCNALGDITAISLFGKGLKGSIPTILGTLSQLQAV
ncbi:unnamed protein product, partial [Closterium sp. NIES-53]